ncbi:MAG: hypothetical protein JWP40_13 [Blastococcus sp.]|jgi:hypothetical protein|nr:hypothetical protein [Blastococcus sp.]
MTPTRVVLGIAVVAAAGYGVIHSVNSEGPRYLGDFPSIMEQAQARPPPITHATPGPPVPDPPHFQAQQVLPEAPAAPPPDPAGPGPIGPAAPLGGGGTSGPANAQPGAGSPLTGSLLPSGGLLSGLLGNVPPLDLSKYCVVAGKVVALVPCDQISPVVVPPGGVAVP